jgi:hypothetical protein
MPRTRYTRFVRRIELRRVIHQEKELVSIRQRLRCPDADVSTEPPVDQEKELRCIHYNRKHCYRTPRYSPLRVPNSNHETS